MIWQRLAFQKVLLLSLGGGLKDLVTGGMRAAWVSETEVQDEHGVLGSVRLKGPVGWRESSMCSVVGLSWERLLCSHLGFALCLCPSPRLWPWASYLTCQCPVSTPVEKRGSSIYLRGMLCGLTRWYKTSKDCLARQIMSNCWFLSPTLAFAGRGNMSLSLISSVYARGSVTWDHWSEPAAVWASCLWSCCLLPLVSLPLFLCSVGSNTLSLPALF